MQQTMMTRFYKTPHFLQTIGEINRKIKQKENAMLVTIDVKALFTNILHKEGCLTEELGIRNHEVSVDFLAMLMKILLKQNIFPFKFGSAMGSPPVP